MIRETILQTAKARGLSAYRLARMSGVPQRTVQAYYSGERDLTGARLDKLAAALGLELRPVRGRRQKGNG